MANTFDLVGSPLGLFTLKSRPTRDGMSSFNGGRSRNINVIAYNTGKKQTTNLRRKDGSSIDSPVSLFSGGVLPNFWPNIKTAGTDLDSTGSTGEYSGFQRNDLHNNDVYDTSLLNIIEKLSFSKMAALRPQDFAYLKNLGVLPNNRLMIARRFLSPTRDNIMGKSGTPPTAILISWKPEGEDFLDITYGEEWENADADFTNILNNLGKDFLTKGLGDGLGKGGNLTPLPGLTEGLQRSVLVEMGILSKGQADVPLPTGNPNIIKMAKRRKTIGYGQQGSGLKCDVSIKMTVEYEQKFISGIDPTIAWMDIINNALVFGTSKSSNYGLSEQFKNKLNNYTTDPSLLIDDIITGLKAGIDKFQNSIVNFINPLIEKSDNNDSTAKKVTDAANDVLKKSVEFFNTLKNNFLDSIKKAIQKYRIELMGVANALSGSPSTPWHITVGNPLRPVFCSGDMYMSDNVKLTLGPTLAFNDLPSTIKVDFTLKNARPWGLQEILAKFNTGHLRTVNIQKDYLEVETGIPGQVYTDNSIVNIQTPPEETGQSSTSQNSNSTIPTTPTTKENDE